MKKQYQNIIKTISFILNNKIYLCSEDTFKTDIQELNNTLKKSYDDFTDDNKKNNTQLKKTLTRLIKYDHDLGFLFKKKTVDFLKYYNNIITEHYYLDDLEITENLQT